MNKNIDIGGRLHSTATGNIVAGANEIFDDDKNKKQSEINTETYTLVNEVNAKLDGLSPEQQGALDVATKANNNETKLGYYVCSTEGDSAAKVISDATGYILSKGGSIKVKMTNANSANNATLNINSTGAKALYYDGERASANNSWEAGETVEVYYDGTSYYANNVAGGSSDGVFDISVKYPTSGVEGGNTYTLGGALSVLNANLAASKKKGGMSIKFVQSSDNKYVQYRLMSDTFNTTLVNWQGVDDEPTDESNNLVKSSGIYTALQDNPRFTLFKKDNIAKSLVVATAEQIITGVYLENEDGTPIEYTKEINGVTYYLGILSIRQGKPNNNIKRAVSIGYAPMDNNNTFNRFVVLGNTETISYVGVEHMIAHNIQGFKTVEIWIDWDKYDETIEESSNHLYELFKTNNNGSITTYRYKRDYKYIGIDQEPVQNSTNPITSGAVYEINRKFNNKINTINEVLSEEKQTKTTDVTTVHGKVVVMQNGVPVETTASSAFRYGIIPVTGLKHVITFSSTASYETKIPAIIFLRTNEITQASYIAGSEKYGTGETPNPDIIAKFDEDIVIPSEANYVIINCFVNYADDTTVITRDVFYDLSEFDERITELDEQLNPQKKVLTVKKQPGDGEYGTIAAALAIADSETTIYIYSGVYEENHLNLPKGITIIGIGDVEIRGYLPPSTAIATSTNYSTLECYNGATLENLKITAQNMRYPIHADFSDGNAKWDIKNCIFEHKGNKEINDYWAAQTGDTSGIVSACSAWGGGTKGGDNVYCFNCKFISTGRAFSTHNNAESSYENYGASHVVLESCEMISKGIDRDGVLVDLLAPLFIQSLNCPVDGCDVVVNNCSLNGYIVFQNSGGDGWSNKLKVFNCGKNKIAFSGYGSGPSLIRNGGQITTYQSHYDKYPLISDCCHSFVNRGASAITKGKAVKLTNNSGVVLYDNTADDVFGVAMQDIAVGEVGDVWFDGYLSRIWLDGIRTTNVTEGDNIYVDNTGSFAVSGTKIAFKAVDNQNIKLFN